MVALRDPLSVATSLHARNGFSLNRGLVLWWIYNHHIAAQLCTKDLLITYSSLLSLDTQTLQQLIGPFLEFHSIQRPSKEFARDLIESLLKTEFNRSEEALNAESRTHINPLLWKVSQKAYDSIIQDPDKLTSFQEHFNSLPRAVLECSARDQLLPEAETSSLRNSLNCMESEMRKIGCSLEQRDRDYVSLQSQLEDNQRALDLVQDQLRDLQNSTSWRITAPLRALGKFFRQ